MEMPLAAIGHPTGDVMFCIPNKAAKWRVDTFFTKEPDTLQWIEEMNPGEVLVDVGANVGMYSVWAAKTRGVKVFAFEPEAQNFALLNLNIMVNKIDAIAYPVALSDHAEFAPLYLAQIGAGGSCHQFGVKVAHDGSEMRPKFTQGSYCIKLDRLVMDGTIPQPDFIKIDVDGIEPAVLRGAGDVLNSVKSVLVELNSNLAGHRRVADYMAFRGFKYDEAQVKAAQRTEGAFKGVGNVIFRR